MILVDTGPIVALFDRDDNYHAICVEHLKTIKHPLLTTWPVITEAFYLLSFSWVVQDDLWLFIERGGIIISPMDHSMRTRCRELMKQYKDLPMDLADSTLVALGEQEAVSKIFTLDHKDFSIYKMRKRKRFKLVPANLERR